MNGKRSIAWLLAALCLLHLAGCTRQSTTEEKQLIECAGETGMFDEKLSWANGDGGAFSVLGQGALNDNTFAISMEMHIPIYRFDTLEELRQFQTEHEDKITITQGREELPSFAETAQKYDKRFFAENSLLLVYVWTDNPEDRFGIREVTTEDGRLCIRVARRDDPAEGEDNWTGFFLTAAIPHDVAAEYTIFDAVREHESMASRDK